MCINGIFKLASRTNCNRLDTELPMSICLSNKSHFGLKNKTVINHGSCDRALASFARSVC